MKIFIQLLTIIFMLIFAGLPAASAEPKNIKPITNIGLLLPLSGPFATGGYQCRDGVKVAEKLYPNSDIVSATKLVYADSIADTKTAIIELRKLIEHDQIAALLAARSNVCLAIAPGSNQSGLAASCLVGHPDFITQAQFGIRTWPSVNLEAGALAKGLYQAIGKGGSVAIVTLEDEWMVSMEKEFVKEAEKFGLKIITRENVAGTDSDFRNLYPRLKTADAIFANLGPAQLGTFLKQLHEFKYKGKKASTVFVAQQDVTNVASAEAREGVYFAEANFDLPKFQEAYQKTFGRKDSAIFTYLCYAGMWLIYDSIAQLQNKKEQVTRKNLLAEILASNKLKLADEELPIIAREIIFKVVVKQIRNNQIFEFS